MSHSHCQKPRCSIIECVSQVHADLPADSDRWLIDDACAVPIARGEQDLSDALGDPGDAAA